MILSSLRFAASPSSSSLRSFARIATKQCLRSFSVSTTQSSDKLVGFIGLGNMGAHQAANLLKHGYNLIVYDINKDSTLALQKKGAKVAESLKEVATQASVIVTMLPASPHVRSAYYGTDDKPGMLSFAQKGTLFLDSSTIDPGTAREVAGKAKEKGISMVDCPVSGGTRGAEEGTLTFMVGGDKADFERAKPYLQCMGKNIVHCGDIGTGQVAKVCNNLILGISMIGVSEAMNLGVKLGIDPKILAGIINTSSGRCWTSEVYNPCPGVLENVPASRGYTGGFGSALMAKDLGLAVDSARTSGESLPLGSAAHQLYNLMVSQGYGTKDFSVFYEFLQKKK
eukprot:TRINITY_DN1472_c0_g1_i1.p1 TRINITY_DN1472_c0_g1~~TRINITY_DN1472_c0_g1_i1.p1  ORF type:complete len:340 (+),score=68.81 TRINITY_DN1472_c0_g1_i1:84-1103(+)